MNMDRNELRQRVGTVFIVMMENRSFDHVLGHLSLPDHGQRGDIDGITALDKPDYANPSANGTMIFPFIMADGPLTNDVPHERLRVAEQLAFSAVANRFTMTGFVKAYEGSTGTSGVLDPPPMGLLTSQDLLASSFFAREYAVCDRWHAPLPTSTQPNRLMAMSGYTERDTTISGLLPNQHAVFDWLSAHGVRWRVYSAGISFYTLMPKLWPLLLTDHFRNLNALSNDIQNESDTTWPEVVIIEPDYDDSPVHLSGHASDNHPPLPMAFGEAFLRQVYEAATGHSERWSKSVMIVTYDENGGFYDHVPPVSVPSEPPPGVNYPRFESTGARVPAFIVSPLVARSSVKRQVLDHTSILQLLAERFGGPGEMYSEAVDARRRAGIGSVSAALDSGNPRTSIPQMSSAPIAATAALATWRDPKSNQQQAFVAGIEGFAKAHGTLALTKYPQIAHWLSP
jgi:phospholipase C